MILGRERRSRRSDDLAMALQFLLTSQRERAGLTHILLCSTDGILLACDGDRTECEELAAYAPFIARGEGFALDPRRLTGVSVNRFRVGREDLLMLLRGDADAPQVAPVLMAAIEGVARILGDA